MSDGVTIGAGLILIVGLIVWFALVRRYGRKLHTALRMEIEKTVPGLEEHVQGLQVAGYRVRSIHGMFRIRDVILETVSGHLIALRFNRTGKYKFSFDRAEVLEKR